MSTAILFNDLFIEFVKSIFFRDPKKRWTAEEMFLNMPSFYQDQHMVNSAINILLMRGDLIQHPLNGSSDEYSASPDAIAKEKAKQQLDDLNKQIDFKIKQLTRDSLTWQRWPQKYWYLVMLLSIFLSVVITKVSETKEKAKSSSLNQQEIQVTIDNSANRKKDSLP